MSKAGISDELYALAQAEATLQGLSVTQQLELWAQRGLVTAEHVAAAQGAMSALDYAVAVTKKLDTLDVLNGRRSADWLHFIPRSMARQTNPVFPLKYRKS